MLLLLILMLVACSLARIPYLCKEVRFETEREADQRRLYEHCTETCDDNGKDKNACVECRIPYEGYGCLKRKQEVQMNCNVDCDLLLPDRTAQMKCVEQCNIAKPLQFFL